MADRHIGNEGLRAVEGVPLNKWRTRAMTTNQPNSMGYLAAPGRFANRGPWRGQEEFGRQIRLALWRWDRYL